ncbi:hypothetical protein ACOMHN_043417 [Nucella lapillus]
MPSNNYKSGLTGCGCFLKYSMFLFNAIILIAGCGLLGFGVYSRTNESWVSRYSAILGSYLLSTLSLILISVGGIVILLAFLGCCGAIKEVRCMLVMFFTLLLLMLMGLMIGSILAYVYKDQIGERVLTELYSSLNTSYGAVEHAAVTGAWDNMQHLFSCCGVYGDINSTTSWAFYRNTLWYLNQTADDYREFVPSSCCRNAMGENRTRCTGSSPVYHHLIPATLPPVYSNMDNDIMFTEGCYSAFISFVSGNIKILGGVGVGVALMMMLAMAFSICLCRRIKDDYFFD